MHSDGIYIDRVQRTSVRARADVGESDESVSWCASDTIASGVHDGRTGLAISGRGKPPRASKHDLKMQFLKLLSSIFKDDANSSIAKANGTDVHLFTATILPVSLLKKRLQDSYAFAKRISRKRRRCPTQNSKTSS